MRYEEIKDRTDKDFKRLTGVEHQTFKQMVAVLESEMPNFGRPPKLSRTDQLLLTLMYWQELGITKLHANSQIPAKKSKLHPLTPEQKATNRELASKRIFCEHIIGRLIVFRILSDRYLNRRKRFGLRFNLIAAIYNLELQAKS